MSESPRKETEEEFHPLNVIQPEKWNNIPTCIIDAFRVLISETKANDLKIKFVQDKLIETQKRVDKQIKNVEKMVTTVENGINDNINQFKEATKKTQNSLNFEIGLVSERSNDNLHSNNVLQRKLEELDRNVYNNYKLKSECADEMKKMTTDMTVQIDVSQSFLKEMLNSRFQELSEVPGLAGHGKKFPDIRSLVRDLHDNYQSKANFLDEVAENRDEYFKRICGRFIDEMNLPQKLKTSMRNELKPEIIKETIAKLDEKIEITKEEVNTIITKKVIEMKQGYDKVLGGQDDRIKLLEQKQGQNIGKLAESIKYVSSETEKKLMAIQNRMKQVVDDINMRLDSFGQGKGLPPSGVKEEKRGSILFQPNLGGYDLKLNEQQFQSGDARIGSNENKRVSLLVQPQQEQQMLLKSQDRSVSNYGPPLLPESGPSTIEQQQSDSKIVSPIVRGSKQLNQSEINIVEGSSNLIFNTNSNIRNSINQNIASSERRPISGVSSKKRGTVVESADGTSIEDANEIQDNSVSRADKEDGVNANMMKSGYGYGDDMVSYKDEQRMNEMNQNNNEYLYEPERDFNIGESYYGEQRNTIFGQPISASSKNSFLLPQKANVETQTVQENMLEILSNFDITKMEPYTLEFLKVLEGELSTMRFSIKEVREELNLHLNYHYYLERNGEGIRDHGEKKTQRDISPQTFDNVLSDLRLESNDTKKSRPRTTGLNPTRVKLSPMLMLKMISRRRELESKMKQINELSMENRGNQEPLISIKSHSVEVKLNRPGLDSSFIGNSYGNNTIRETKEYLENDERDMSRFTNQSSPGNHGINKRNKAEDTSDLIANVSMNEEKKVSADQSIFLPSILKKPLNTKMAEIGFDPKTKEEILQQKLMNETNTSFQKSQKPKPPEKKQVSQTEWKKKVESVI